MIRTGKVISCKNGNCDIEFVKLEACSKCGGCKLNNTPAQISIPGEFKVGEYVDVSLPDEQFLKATAAAYLIPLLGLVLGLVLGNYLPNYWGHLSSDITTLIGGIAGLALSIFALGISERLRKKPAAWEPQIIGKVDDPSCTGLPAFTMDSTRTNKGEYFMGNTVYLVESDFEAKVLKSDKPVLVDFTATWCGPCRMLAPTIDKLSEDMAGKANVYKVDVDENPGLAQRYGIMSIPTIITFNNGEVKEKIVGLAQKSNLENMLNKLM